MSKYYGALIRFCIIISVGQVIKQTFKEEYPREYEQAMLKAPKWMQKCERFKI